jgi:hypothetical protein
VAVSLLLLLAVDVGFYVDVGGTLDIFNRNVLSLKDNNPDLLELGRFALQVPLFTEVVLLNDLLDFKPH